MTRDAQATELPPIKDHWADTLRTILAAGEHGHGDKLSHRRLNSRNVEALIRRGYVEQRRLGVFVATDLAHQWKAADEATMPASPATVSPSEIAQAAAARLRTIEDRPTAQAVVAEVAGAALAELARIFYVYNRRAGVAAIRELIVEATAGVHEDTAAINSPAWRNPADMAATPGNVTRALRALWPDPVARIESTLAADDRVEIRCPRFDHTGVTAQVADLVSQVLKAQYEVTGLTHGSYGGVRSTLVRLARVAAPADMPAERPHQRTRASRTYAAGDRVWAYTCGAWRPAIVRSQFIQIGLVVDGERESANGLDGSTRLPGAVLPDKAVAPRTTEYPAIEPASRCSRCKSLVWLTDKGWLHSGDVGIDPCDHYVDGVDALPPPWKVAQAVLGDTTQAEQPATDVSPAVLHNLVGWDLLTGDGWQTIREVKHPLGDTYVTTDETEPGDEWAFYRRDVTVRAPRDAVELLCGHHGVPGTGRGRNQTHGFCWFGCFKTHPVVGPPAPSTSPVGADEWTNLPGAGGRVVRWGTRVAAVANDRTVLHHAIYPTEARARAEYANVCGNQTAAAPQYGDRLLAGTDPTGPLLTVVSAEPEPGGDGFSPRFRVTVASRGAGGAECEVWNLEPGGFRFLERPVPGSRFQGNRASVPPVSSTEPGSGPAVEPKGDGSTPRRNRSSHAGTRRSDLPLVEYAIEEHSSGRPTWHTTAAGLAPLASPTPGASDEERVEATLRALMGWAPPHHRRRRISGHIVGTKIHAYIEVAPSSGLFQRTARAA